MADDKKVTISRTLNGDKIYHIARNSSGVIFARALTPKDLDKAIKAYKEPTKEEVPVGAASTQGSGEPKKKFLVNKLLGKVQEARKRQQSQKETPSTQEPISNAPKQIKNGLQGQVEQRRKNSKKSFWDKLK